MSSIVFKRIQTLLAGAAISGVAAYSIVTPQVGVAAVVGASRTIAVQKATDATLDQMREAYRRPPAIPFPKDNPYTTAKVELGKKLYFDPRLSASRTQSCGTCHNPGLAWGDGLARGVGHKMDLLGRRSPTIVNGAYTQIFMWDSRFNSLEEQALGPIQSNAEMNLTEEEAVARVNEIPQYRALFAAAFPNEAITLAVFGKAIATYERTVVSGRAPFDAWIDGDEKAISESAKKGFVVFNQKGNCAACHSGWNFTDDSSHDIGLDSTDIGRGKYLPDVEKMQFAFKTPGLREIAKRGPYMHDGAMPTLEAVIAHYDTAGVNRPSRSDAIKPLGLTSEEKSQLIAFLYTLSSEGDSTTIPALPR